VNKKILAPGIVLYKTDLARVNSIMEMVDSFIGDKWNVAKGVNTDKNEAEIVSARKCYDYALFDLLNPLYQETDLWISECLKDYTAMYSVEKVEMGPYIFLKYENSDKFDWHIDDGKMFPRTVSVSAYLNDGYDGGELEFSHFGISHKPSAGDIVLFSASFPYMHRVTPIKNGVRYAIVNWYRYEGYPMRMS
jgi:predicted 2-oxoglutarate/Fe(II)-dependent dioxygenase YbiX